MRDKYISYERCSDDLQMSFPNCPPIYLKIILKEGKKISEAYFFIDQNPFLRVKATPKLTPINNFFKNFVYKQAEL